MELPRLSTKPCPAPANLAMPDPVAAQTTLRNWLESAKIEYHSGKGPDYGDDDYQGFEQGQFRCKITFTHGAVADARRIDPALRAKYDTRGPRYTSYPPATEFTDIDPSQVLGCWRDRNRLYADPGLSLYFHIPFCR